MLDFQEFWFSRVFTRISAKAIFRYKWPLRPMHQLNWYKHRFKFEAIARLWFLLKLKQSIFFCPLQFWECRPLRQRILERHCKSGNHHHARTLFPPEASSSFCLVRTAKQKHLYPTLKANPCAKGTDLFCQCGLSSINHRPQTLQINSK